MGCADVQKHSQVGQVLVFLVLVMVIVLTVGLSIASRSIINVRISTEEENSQRAFSAAEAGIEEILKRKSELSSVSGTFFGTSASYNTTLDSASGSEIALNNGSPVFKDHGIDVWFSEYPNYSNPVNPQHFLIYWGFPNDDCSNPSLPAAIEVIVISGSLTNPISTRYGFDPCPRGNGFSNEVVNANRTISGRDFRYKLKFSQKPDDAIDVSNNPLLMRIIPLYTNTPIAVCACSQGGGSPATLPSQGTQVNSIGTSGGTVRKISVFQGHSILTPEFFQYSLFIPK